MMQIQEKMEKQLSEPQDIFERIKNEIINICLN